MYWEVYGILRYYDTRPSYSPNRCLLEVLCDPNNFKDTIKLMGFEGDTEWIDGCLTCTHYFNKILMFVILYSYYYLFSIFVCLVLF